MGFTPQQVMGMTPWQFGFALEGWMKANTMAEKMSDQEKDDIWEWMQDRPPVPLTRRKLN